MNESRLPLGNRTIMVCGSRDWNDADRIDDELSRHVVSGDTLIHGGAKGADTLTEQWAGLYGVPTMVFRPNYELYGRKKAPHVRNDHMLNIADQVVAFWDGSSRGTGSVIRKARERGIPVDVYGPEEAR